MSALIDLFVANLWGFGLVAVLLLLLNAVLVAAEMATLKVRFSHFDETLREWLESRKRLNELLAEGELGLQGLRLGQSLCTAGFVLIGFGLIWHGMAVLGWNPAGALWLHGLTAVGIFWVLALLQYLLGEAVPRLLGLAAPGGTLRRAGWLLLLVDVLVQPVRWPVNAVVGPVWRWLRKEAPPEIAGLELETQIEELNRETPELSAVAHLIFKNALAMRELVVADVLLPRNQVKYFDLNLSLQENLQMAKETGHTRFPLCFGDLDHCLGLIHIKDIFRFSGDLSKTSLRKLKRDMIRIDSEEPLEQALTRLLSHKMHMALVIDEFRGTEGVLTLERILEQLVGDIRDEFDTDEQALIRPEGTGGELRVSGLMPLHELEQHFDIEIESEEVSTLSGLVTSEIGRIPEAGESLRVNGLQVEVLEVDETRIIEALVCLAPADTAGGEDSKPEG